LSRGKAGGGREEEEEEVKELSVDGCEDDRREVSLGGRGGGEGEKGMGGGEMPD
jgi:hypothetical protein